MRGRAGWGYSPATWRAAAAPNSCPATARARVHQTKEPQHKDDFDEWLARIVCFAFSVPPQWAVKQMNRATADNQSAQSEEEGLEPTKEWVKDLVDEIIAEEFASPDLELHWLDEDDGDPETVLADRLKLGAVTLNEMRDHLGLDPYPNPAADRAMVLTPTGYVPIEANAGAEGQESRMLPSSKSTILLKRACLLETLTEVNGRVRAARLRRLPMRRIVLYQLGPMRSSVTRALTPSFPARNMRRIRHVEEVVDGAAALSAARL